MSRETCRHSQQLSQLVDEKLAVSAKTQLEAHLETCDVCQRALDQLVDKDETAARARRHLRQSTPVSDPALQGVMHRIRSASDLTHIPESVPVEDFAVDYLRPAEDADALGRLGPYQVSEVIGRGGMGIVLKGHDARLNRMVAVKVLSPALAQNPTARRRFLREAQAAAAVGHPNVVTIYSVDEDRLPYLVMEFVDGPSLQKRLDTEGFLEPNQILRIGAQVASGLAAAHAQGLVHRDIKPGNILLENGMERVKLTDFGLARAADDASVTREGTIVGTPEYMSPEQARGEAVDQASDQFSLGSVLYAVATGRPPFRAETTYGVMRKITDESPVPIRELNPEISSSLCDIIERLMAKDKADRFESVAQVHGLLEACLNHARQPTVTQPPLIPARPHRNRLSPVLKLFAGVFAMIAVTMSVLFALGIPFAPGPVAEPSPATGPVAGPAASPADGEGTVSAVRSRKAALEREFEAVFPDSSKPGTLNVDIKRGSIHVSGYDGDKVLVQLSVPGLAQKSIGADGLQELRPNSLDFDVEEKNGQIKVDGNSYDYITNLTIKVPHRTNLILDTYRDGQIHVQDVEGTFNIRSQNNDICLEEVAGSGRLWTYNGVLSASLSAVPQDGKLEFESYNGSIELKLPADIKATAKYRSGSGRVRTDFDVAVADDIVRSVGTNKVEFDEFRHGTINGGGLPLTIETEKGDIRLLRRRSVSTR